MKILVLVKQVPDTYGERKLSPDTGRVVRTGVENVIDEVGERALEVALAYQESAGADVTAVTMGPADAAEALRKALAMGADDAVHVVDDRLAGADLGRTSEALAAVAKARGFDLIITGNESTDGRGGALPAMLAERLGIPHATYLNSAEISETSVRGERQTENGTLEVSAPLPAVISITERGPEPRFPSFRGLMKAKKKPLETLGLDQLAIEAEAAGRSELVSVSARPAREAGTKIVDNGGDSAALLVEYLVSNRII